MGAVRAAGLITPGTLRSADEYGVRVARRNEVIDRTVDHLLR
jgi:hypothetical protein